MSDTQTNPVVRTHDALKQSAAAERAKIRKERLAQLRKNKAFIVGASILGFWVLCALIGQLLVRIDPNALGYLNGVETDLAPNGTNWFGTDADGRDVFSRVIVGSRPIIVMATLATLIGGIQSGMGYLGAANLAELRKRARYIRVSPAGMKEAGAHDVVEVKTGN